MADKMTKMELEEPDKLQIFFEEFMEYVKHNRTKIMIIAAAVVVLVRDGTSGREAFPTRWAQVPGC